MNIHLCNWISSYVHCLYPAYWNHWPNAKYNYINMKLISDAGKLAYTSLVNDHFHWGAVYLLQVNQQDIRSSSSSTACLFSCSDSKVLIQYSMFMSPPQTSIFNEIHERKSWVKIDFYRNQWQFCLWLLWSQYSISYANKNLLYRANCRLLLM